MKKIDLFYAIKNGMYSAIKDNKSYFPDADMEVSLHRLLEDAAEYIDKHYFGYTTLVSFNYNYKKLEVYGYSDLLYTVKQIIDGSGDYENGKNTILSISIWVKARRNTKPINLTVIGLTEKGQVSCISFRNTDYYAQQEEE